MPLPGLAARLSEYPFTDGDDESCLLGERGKLGRQHQAHLGMPPAQQGFGAADDSTLHVDLWLEMQEAKIGDTGRSVIEQTCMVFGQMNEPPGNRLRVGLTGLTMAEYFRDKGEDVLLFIDNIFRFDDLILIIQKVQTHKFLKNCKKKKKKKKN